MTVTGRIGSVSSWPESRGIFPFETFYVACDFEVYVWRAGIRFSKRFYNQFFATASEVPDTGNDIDVDFNEQTGEITLLS